MKQKSHIALSRTRWLAYAAAGAATPFSIPLPADAEIHYSGIVDQQLAGARSTSALLPLIASKSIALSFTRHLESTSGFKPYAASDLCGIGAGSIAGVRNTCVRSLAPGSASNLSRGEMISQRPFLSANLGRQEALIQGVGTSSCSGHLLGHFFGPTTGYIGFRFNQPTGISYGWARIRVGQFSHNGLRVVDYAYADPGEPIAAGQKRSTPSDRVKAATPARSSEESLGALALGAAGIIAARQGRVARAVQRNLRLPL